MRMIVIKKDTDLKSLRGQLLKAKTGSGQADSAVNMLQAANPHVDLTKLRAGTVLLVPDSPSFNAAASDPVPADTFDEFQQLIRDGLGSAADKVKSGSATRASERNEVSAAVSTDVVKRLLASDAELKQQVADATRTFKEEQQQDAQATKDVAAAGKAALAKLDELAKLLG